MHYPVTDIQADFEINRPVRYQMTAKRHYFRRRQTDRQPDGQTRARQQYVVFSKKKSKNHPLIYPATVDEVNHYY